MNRKLVLGLVLAVAGLLASGQKAVAVIGTIDVVPASTLLVPYFEVDLDNQNGVNTLFAIGNSSASATLAHVTIWTDWSIPVLDFDVYLTGFDIETISLYNVLVKGELPQTASNGQDTPGDTISPHGPISQDINFASCNGFLPYNIPAVSQNFRNHLAAVLTGKKSPVDGSCAGENHGDNIARGYVTIDVTNACSQQFPSDTGYFVKGGGGIAGDRNILLGDYFYVNPTQNFAQGNTAVHIEANAPAFTPGEYTFYGRYVNGSAIDDREPLATTFFARFVTSPVFDAGTNYIVWRDSKFPPGSSCTTGPNYGDLFADQIVVFNEEEEPFLVVSGGPSGQPVPGAECIFCNETQSTAVGTDLDTGGFNFGWTYLNLNHATTLDATLGPGYINIAQAWVVVTMSAEGRYSVGYDAFPMDNASTAPPGGRTLPVSTPPN